MLHLLLFDENFNHRILHGLELRSPNLDYRVAQETELKGATDPDLLAFAAEQGRIVVTHDLETLLKYAYDRVTSGLRMPGVIAVPQSLPIGRAIDDLITVLECCAPGDMEDSVLHLPL
jgi:hypothetical protein